MRIAFDAKRIYNNNTGLGNYGRLLVSSLLEEFPQNEYLLYTPNARLNPDFSNILKKKSPDYKNSISASWWRTFKLTKNLITDHVSLYHGLSNELPQGIEKSNIPSVVTIHDLLFLKHPEWYPFLDRKIYLQKFKAACKNAKHIIATSNVVSGDIENYFSIDSKKISVVAQACSPKFKQNISREIIESKLEELSLETKNYFLCVSAFQNRKNQIQLIEAFNISKNLSDSKLVLAGKNGPTYKSCMEVVIKNKLENRVIFVLDASIETLNMLYQGALAFVYPSLEEGFGIPLIEAAFMGAPIICSDAKIFKEVTQNHAIYYKSNDVESLAKLLQKNTLDSALNKSELISNLYSPKLFAQNTMRVYKSLF